VIIGLRLLADGRIMIWGESDDGQDRVHLRNEVPKGGSLCGLPYDELAQLVWIETDAAGKFVSGGRREPASVEHDEIPPFLLRS
jgi:hypothetical protein